MIFAMHRHSAVSCRAVVARAKIALINYHYGKSTSAQARTTVGEILIVSLDPAMDELGDVLVENICGISSIARPQSAADNVGAPPPPPTPPSPPKSTTPVPTPAETGTAATAGTSQIVMCKQ